MDRLSLMYLRMVLEAIEMGAWPDVFRKHLICMENSLWIDYHWYDFLYIPNYRWSWMWSMAIECVTYWGQKIWRGTLLFITGKRGFFFWFSKDITPNDTYISFFHDTGISPFTGGQEGKTSVYKILVNNICSLNWLWYEMLC